MNSSTGPAAASSSSSATSDSLPIVHLFTDGACSGNPGPGGWAYILKHPASGTMREVSGGEAGTTNNRMELRAVIEGLQAIKRPSTVVIFADSKYVLKGLSEWMDMWKAQGWTRGKKRETVKNVELWKTLDKLRELHTLKFEWVRGHAGHQENEQCDRLAVEALEQYR